MEGWEALPDEVVAQVLARLPAMSVLRSRAVCKSWCRPVSGRGFVDAHHRHQPPQPILRFVESPLEQLVGFRAEAIDLPSVGRRLAAQFTHHEDDLVRYVEDHLLFRVHASCDGLLLLNADDTYYLCNPATRRCTLLPPLRAGEVKALYRHAPSGEYRMLLGDDVPPRQYYILSVGYQHASTIELPPAPENQSPEDAYVSERLERGLAPAYYTPPSLVGGRLHWPPQILLDPYVVGQVPCILVFDTEAQVFSWMHQPPVNGSRYAMQLFEMEGKLALSCCHHIRTIELWLMQDYRNQVWVCAHRVEMPVALVSAGVSAYMVSLEGDVLVNRQQAVLHFDREGNLLRELRADGGVEFTRHVFQESLVPPPPVHPPFVWGL